MSEQEGSEYWRWMNVASDNTEATPLGGRWPRGHERRHFRGAISKSSLYDLQVRYANHPEDMVVRIAEEAGERLTLKVITERVQEHRGFGPWIGFKIADMIDRVLAIPIDFDQAAVFMFKDPERAAMMLWEQRVMSMYPPSAKIKREAVLKGVAKYLTDHFKNNLAPPRGDRPVNIQEVETILCKWKSHMNGHYPLYNDIREINTGIQPWTGICDAARTFYAHMPQEDVCPI